ncbi:unnamed protein product [Prunus armeniaca]|uniref:Uncharacterized protein n=1 Tax=Prunus armeniaca TaxID=36596 RepID=A0A6J5XA67_PRUAR|nr:unnamed protein product [Prunus armeniaca]
MSVKAELALKQSSHQTSEGKDVVIQIQSSNESDDVPELELPRVDPKIDDDEDSETNWIEDYKAEQLDYEGEIDDASTTIMLNYDTQ